MELLLKNARIVDPVNTVDTNGEIAVKNGIFCKPNELKSPEFVDLEGKTIAPGLIDVHVHFRDPGQTHKEDISTGSKSAAAGGFTTVLVMPNTAPPVDSAEMLKRVQKRIDETAVVRVLQSACLSVERKGQTLTNPEELKAAGAAALTDDGGCLQNNGLMYEAVAKAKKVGLPVIDHCEDFSLSKGHPISDGEIAELLGVKGQLPAAEDVIVARNYVIAKYLDYNLHIQHLSTKGAVELVRFAKQTGVKMSAEVSPHHILLTSSACKEHGTNAKMNPPLRSKEDRRAILEGLKDGTIECIATDHAPHTNEEKSQPMEKAPFGIIGLETAFPLCLTELCHNGSLTLSELIAKFTVGPRKLLGTAAGTLSLGQPADLIVLDLEKEWTVDAKAFQSRSSNCPYHGMQCKGAVTATLVGGKLVHGSW